MLSNKLNKCIDVVCTAMRLRRSSSNQNLRSSKGMRWRKWSFVDTKTHTLFYFTANHASQQEMSNLPMWVDKINTAFIILGMTAVRVFSASICVYNMLMALWHVHIEKDRETAKKEQHSVKGIKKQFGFYNTQISVHDTKTNGYRLNLCWSDSVDKMLYLSINLNFSIAVFM